VHPPEALSTVTPDDAHRLARVLVACVADGASVGWVAPPTLDDSAAWWRGFLAGGWRWRRAKSLPRGTLLTANRDGIVT
jgi:hypothetical protein